MSKNFQTRIAKTPTSKFQLKSELKRRKLESKLNKLIDDVKTRFLPEKPRRSRGLGSEFTEGMIIMKETTIQRDAL